MIYATCADKRLFIEGYTNVIRSNIKWFRLIGKTDNVADDSLDFLG